MNTRGLLARVLYTGALACTISAPGLAQAFNYPSFQPPRVVEREFNFALADAGSRGTAILFQWREGASARNQLSLDVGFADPQTAGVGNVFFIGGQFAHLLTNNRADLPLDFLLTAGAGLSSGNRVRIVRFPVGLSVGHRFPLEGGLALTPYVHPRLALNLCSDCGPRGNTESDIGLDFDLGVSFEINRQLDLRFSGKFGGGNFFNEDAFGVSLAWSPPSVRR